MSRHNPLAYPLEICAAVIELTSYPEELADCDGTSLTVARAA
jgi:hypothetical protein